MPTIQNRLTVDITPEQFAKACSLEELEELRLNVEAEINNRKERGEGLEILVQCRPLSILRDVTVKIGPYSITMDDLRELKKLFDSTLLKYML